MMSATPFRHLLPAAILVVTIAGQLAPVMAQTGSTRDSALTEEEQVTAVDLVIELSKGGEVVAPPPGVTQSDFLVEEGGRRLAVVGLDIPPGSEPWHVLIYFDHELSSAGSIRWGATALADRALALTELGEVQVVIADPEPRLILGPTRNAVLLDQMLSGIFLESVRGSALLALREEFLLARQQTEGLSGPEVVNALVAEEGRLVGSHQDALLSLLVDDLPGTARRAIFLVSDGFDQRPEEFYAEYAEIDETHPGALERSTRDWVKTAAAYGWTVITVQVPEEERQRALNPLGEPIPNALSIKTPAIAARLEGTLDPEKAAAHHELGQRLAEQGELDDAVTSFNEALRFYHGHKKYSRQRATVLLDLGAALQALERRDEARQAIRQAVDLDEALASDHPFIDAELRMPSEPLELLTEQTGGRTTLSGEDLSAAIASLARRVRLTFQFQGSPDGESHPVGVAFQNQSFKVTSPAWVRFGTPRAVQDLRARRLLSGDLDTGELTVTCRFTEATRSYSARTGALEIRLEPSPVEDSVTTRPLRLSIGLAPEEGPYEIRHADAEFVDGVFELPLEIGDDDVWLAVVIDDPVSGSWGAATTELQ